MLILNSTREDLDEIFNLYKSATQLQIKNAVVPWPKFERRLIIKEIDEYRQWKITEDGKIACIWATCFSDPLIWEEKNNDPAVYIHRIATNPDFRGNKFVVNIINWAKEYAKQNGKEYIRMDTVGMNEKLINHYTSCGFSYLGLFKLKKLMRFRCTIATLQCLSLN